MAISGNYTFAATFKNENVNEKTAQQYTESNLSNATTLDEETQGSILSDFLDNFSGFESKKGIGDTIYFSRIDENGNTECIKVLDDDGENKIVYTTIEKGSNEGTTEIYSITDADKLNNWNSSENAEAYDNGEEIDDLEMFDYDQDTYIEDVEAYAQEFINKYDEDGDGNWNQAEFNAMASDGVEIPEEDAAEFSKLYKTLFEDFQMDEDNETISAGEFASQLIMGDIDWANCAENTPISELVGSKVDGNLNFENYNSVSADPTLDTYEDDLSTRKDIYDNYYAAKES